MSSPLSAEQLDQLLPGTKEIMLQYFNDQTTRLDDMRAKYERLRLDSEQKYFELERQQVADHSRLEIEAKAAADLRWQVSDLEKKYNETSEKYRELQSKYFSKSEYWNEQEQTLVSAKARLESEKFDLTELLDKRNREVDRLTAEWKQMSERLDEATKGRIEAQNKAGEAKSELVIVERREGRLKQELDNVTQQNDWLNKELQERIQELMTSRKEKSARLMELQSQLDESTLEAEHCRTSLEAARTMNTELTEQIEQYAQKLKDARDGNAQLEEQYRNELMAQEKLLELYKVTAQEAEDKVTEMTKAVDELKKLLKQATHVYSELQTEREEDNRVSQELIADRDAKIERMEKELTNANELLEVSRQHERQLTCHDDAEIVSSAAANVSRLIKSGMTLTQIYSEYVQACSSLQSEKEENKRLSDYLDRILHEIEEKAPILKKQKQDYEKCLESVTQLTHQLDSAMVECEKCRVSSEDDRRRCGELTRENQRHKQQTHDLSRQVRMLLRELEEARGTVVRMTQEDDGMEVSSSSGIITSQLVTFKSIEELQEQNQKLLAVVRELSNDQELRETETRDSKIASLQQQLDDAVKQIDEMKAARRRQAEMVESLVQQRDMYRTLATQPALISPRAAATSGPVTPVASTPLPAVSTVAETQASERELAALEDTKNSLKELQEEFAVYRREKSENERLLNEQLEKVSKESTSLRVQNARLASQLDFTGERLKVLQSNAESNHTEAELLRDKNTKFIASLARHQETISKLQEDLLATKDKLTHAEVRCQSLAAEKERLKSSEARLISENEMLHRNQQTRDQLVISLEAIQNNLERSEFETKSRLTRQIEKLDRENAILRQKSEGTDTEQRAFVVTLERQLGEAKQEVERERTKLSCTIEQLTTAQEHVAHLKEELSVAEGKLQAAQSKLATTLTSQRDDLSDKRLEDEVQRYRDLLDEASRQISNLQEQLTRAEQHAAQYKTIADGVECSLREQTAASEQYKQSMDARLAEMVQANEALESQVKQLEGTVANLSEENSSLVKENATLVEEKANHIAEVRHSDTAAASQLSSVRKTLEETENHLQEALSNEALARHDCQRQLEEAKAAKQNYERELLLHATDIENLAQVKRELDSFNDKLEEAKADAQEARSTLTSSQASWAEQEQSLRVEMDKLKEKATELQSQNTALHQELERMSGQMLQLQSREEKERDKLQQFADTVDSSSSQQQSSSSEQLLDVVQYLRKEKGLAEARFEVIQAETNRLRQQVMNLRKQADAAEQALAEERQKTEVNLQTAAQHAELMRKVETLNLLQDSNHLLRDERNRFSEQLQDIEAKAKRLESELMPLQDECRDAVAQRDSLQKEVELLRSETDRWKARTNHLIEQCNKFDPEEHKRAIEERDESKKQLSTVMEESHKHRAELSRINSLLRSAQSDCEQNRQQIQNLNDELAKANAAVVTKDAEVEEKNTTIAQLRKIGQKYRMQAKEVQKEIEELKTQNAVAEQTSQSDAVALRERLELVEKERDDLTCRLGSADVEKNDAVRKLKDLEQRSRELHERLVNVTEECTKLTNDNSELDSEVKKLSADKEKDAAERHRLESENTSVGEEKKKLLLTLQTAKQRLVALRTDKESLESSCAELKQQLEAAVAEKESAELPSTEPSADEQVEAVRTEMQATVARLDTELTELQQSRTALQHDSAQQLESLDRLRRENTELQQRVHLLQNQLESASKQVAASPAKPTVSAPPVERTAASDTGTEQHTAPRKANIRPIASQQPHIRSVQPVRGSSTETRAMASIRPMAASVVSSVSSVSTPMATVMPTTATVSDSEGVSLLISPAIQSVPSVQQPPQQAGRPTQQVQPVSSHFEEATVSSSEEQSTQVDTMQTGGIMAHWWHVDATPSTSSERDGSSAGSSGVGKRPRDDSRTQEEGSLDAGVEVPSKRSKTSGEVADTTEASNGGVPQPATLAAGTESEREAASVAQIEAPSAAEPCIRVRRDTEPVTTSLNTEEQNHASNNAQEEDVRTVMGERVVATQYSGEMLPDYQEVGETAAGDFEVRPSTSRSREGTPMSDDPRDDSGEAGGVDDCQEAESVSINDEAGNVEDEDDDVILIEVDDGDGDADVGEVGYGGDAADVMDDYQQSADDSDFDPDVANEDYIVAEPDFDIIDEIERSEGEESFDGELSEAVSQDRDHDVGDDLIIVGAATEQHFTTSTTAGELEQLPVAAYTSSSAEAQQNTPRQLVTASVSAPAAVRLSHSTAEPQMPSSTQQQLQPRHVVASVSTTRYSHVTGPQVTAASRVQLMPFILGSESGSGYEFGDDGIVPCTPTLQVPQRSDGFAEAVCSPQVRNERFMFSASNDSLPHSQLAHQEGVGVDDTRMDLSQFDEGRSGSMTGHSASQPDIIITAGSSDELEQTAPLEGGTESSDVMPTAETTHSFSEPSVSGSVESHGLSSSMTAGEEAEQAEDVAADQSRMGQRNHQEEQPSTSSGLQVDRAAQERHEASHAQSKPKIQRIVWEEDRNVTASASPSTGSVAQGTVVPLLPGSTEHMHHAHRGGSQPRGFSRMPMPNYRSQPRHAARPMMQPSVQRQRTPGGLQVTRQVARRASARGRSPAGQRQQFY